LYTREDSARDTARDTLRGQTKKGGCMARKSVVKVVLSKEQHEILTELATRLGASESEAMRWALMDYAKDLSLMSETIHRKKPPT
jgi:hypothetical protein